MRRPRAPSPPFWLALALLVVVLLYSAISVDARHEGGPSRVKAWTNALPERLLELLEEDIRHVRVYEEQFGTLTNYKKRTRWFPADARPKTALEYAIRVLESFVKPDQFGRPYMGAEWWVQVVPAGSAGKIGFHVDKDEAIASLEHYLVHPTWGSILYVTDSGGCTLITDQHSPTGNGYHPLVAEEGELVCPQRNKYAIFNGTLLHGVIPGRDEFVKEPERMTFLVNWWAQTPKPPNCEKLPHKKVEGLRYLSKKKLRKLVAEIEEAEQEQPTPRRRRVSPQLVDLRPEAKHAGKSPESYVHTYPLPGGAQAASELPKNIEHGATYTIKWTDRAATLRPYRDEL